MVPLAAVATLAGGWWPLLLPLYAWVLVTVLDRALGDNHDNRDPQTPDSALFWHRLVTLVWLPLQALTVYGAIWYVTGPVQRGVAELLGLFFGLGVMSGTIGIVYAHELMHQRNRLERWLGDLLLAMVLYSHFRSEHLLVHHVHVGTPRDAVTARYNEGFHRYFARVLLQCPPSAWRAERAMAARAGRGMADWRNPFWRYGILQALALALALAFGGWTGLVLFVSTALVAIWQLELTNYVEQYGLTRRRLGSGRYEPVGAHHSWNAAHRASNWLLINLQRHSDHHLRPDRRFPLLQDRDTAEAPQLPMGYPAMAAVAMIPPLWRRVMNPRVRAWRRRFYPDITNWHAPDGARAPLSEGAA